MISRRVEELLEERRLQNLFIEELGWNLHKQTVHSVQGTTTYELKALAEKRGLVVFECHVDQGEMPLSAVRRRIDAEITRSVREHLIVFSENRGDQIWQWSRRERGRSLTTREHVIYAGQRGTALAQRLSALTFSIDDEEGLTVLDVAARAKAAFDVDRVTKRFFGKFRTEHKAFLGFIEGIPDGDDREWYASLMLNRLMFIYFLQRKGLIGDDENYLRSRLETLRAAQGPGKFHSFYRTFLLALFHGGLGRRPPRSPDLEDLIGNVPYLNGGLFEEHRLEEDHPAISIPDEAFERLFDFFDSYQWHLDDRPVRSEHEINPDVLGYIFEQYVNQKQMGAYYSKEDITEFITANTVLPAWLNDYLQQDAGPTFQDIQAMLSSDADRYIPGSVKHGTSLPIPSAIQAGIEEPSQRGSWDRQADPDFANPSETWRDVLSRRQTYECLHEALASGRLESVDELVRSNIDMNQLAQDLVTRCDGLDEIWAAYRCLERLTVLDPACGSGAFLFASLRILYPIYEIVLDRMAILAREEISGNLSREASAAIAEIDKHPSSAFFILKMIVVKNLYGVDIMEEAVEICKLRIFLKLVSEIRDTSELEPLPDIDFNIRAGNSLVGFSSAQEARDIASERLDLLDAIPMVEHRLEEVAQLSASFKATQANSSSSSESKAELTDGLTSLGDELDRFAAVQYEVPDDPTALDEWREDFQPFHWLIDFHSIMDGGGFSAVVGNPPYIELSKVTAYRPRGYKTTPCGNLYALFIERALSLTRNGGRTGMIVPMSLACTPRMKEAREVIERQVGSCAISHYSGDANPSTLFEGAKLRLSIILTDKDMTANCNWWSSFYLKWFADERSRLFESVTHSPVVRGEANFGLLPKLGNQKATGILSRIVQHRPLGSQLSTEGSTVYVHRVVTQYIKAFNFIPYFWNELEGVKKSDDYKPYTFGSTEDARVALAVLNSSTFFFYFIALGDGFHCGKAFVVGFPAGLGEMSEKRRDRLTSLGDELMEDMQRNSVRRKANSKKTGKVEYDEFWPRHSKPLIDRIDDELGSHYGFTADELDYLKGFMLKYRLGRDAAEK